MTKQILLAVSAMFFSLFAQAQCNDLFFSEYIEGSGNDKVLELYNPTNAPINLSSYKILLKGFTGTLTPTTGSFQLAGTIASKGTYIICHSSANATILAKKDTSIGAGAGSIMNMNGDDALMLVKNNTDTIDVIGNRFAADTSQAFTNLLANKQLIRKNTVNQGTKDWSVGQTQWTVNASISFADLKLHTIIVCGGAIDTVITFGSPIFRNVDENIGTITIPINSNLSASALTLKADIALISGDAADINGYTTTTVTIPAGATTANLNVTVTDDLIQEGRDTFKFRIQNLFPGSSKIGADSIYTLIINTSDRPAIYYTINTVRGANFNGVPDSIDYAPIILKGTVHGNDLDTSATGIRFVIRDNTGGILVNSFNKNFNYVVKQGDSVSVQGKISHLSGWGTIENLDTLIVLGTGIVKAPQVNTSLGESTESDLIRLNNVYVSPCAFWPSTGIANVDVTDGTTTFTVRLINAQNFTRPTTRFDLIGIGGQFDNTAPYQSGYQIYPRSNADLIPNGNPIPQPPLYSISTVRTDGNANGISDSTNVICRVRGTVIGLSTGTGATNAIIKSDGKGIRITATTKTFGISLVPGDSVEASGKIVDNAGWAEMTMNVCGDTVIKLGTAAMESPRVVTALNETTESDLVRFNGLTRVSGTWSATGNSNHIVKDAGGNQFTVRILNGGGVFGSTDLLTGTFDIIGIAGQFDTTFGTKTKGYQILPRKTADIIKGSAVALISADHLNIYPNPTEGILHIQLDQNKTNKQATISIYNTSGLLVHSTSVQNNCTIDLKNIPVGNYILEYLSEGEKIVKRLIKQ